MATLGKVTHGLSERRGLDLVHRICVPGAWLRSGQRIRVAVPRRLSCAHCEGGGCDACERRGAIALRDEDAPTPSVSVRLARGDPGQAQLLRIPDRGGPAAEHGQPRGCLMLRVEPGDVSRGVHLDSNPREALRPFVWHKPLWLALPVGILLLWWLLSR